MWLRLTRQVRRFRLNDSVGETPTDAVETTALPKKSRMIGASSRAPFLAGLSQPGW
jgi:hypothetical protein